MRGGNLAAVFLRKVLIHGPHNFKPARRIPRQHPRVVLASVSIDRFGVELGPFRWPCDRSYLVLAMDFTARHKGTLT